MRVAPMTIRRVRTHGMISPELARACAGFGILPIPHHETSQAQSRASDELILAIGSRRVILICGPSGSGKSSLLRGIASDNRIDRKRIVPTTLSPDQRTRSVFDCLEGDCSSRASVLSLAGLAEPVLWARPAGVLSIGEQARLRLAITMQHALPGSVILADEFASTIDRANAYALSRTVHRWAHRHEITLIAASAHEDLESMLTPDVVVEASSGKHRHARASATQEIHIERGTREDYDALADYHYRSGMPATVVRVLRAVRSVPRMVHPSERLLAGVLCVSMPTLNAAWRARAWPFIFESGSKKIDAKRINEHLRTISRVIVEPRSRGLGVAAALVRAYLHDPITQGTEAVAAMGSVCPFFERGGMTPYTIEPDLIDTRLLDALEHLGITTEGLAYTQISSGTLLSRELTTWGKQRKLLGPGTPDIEDIERITPIAACRLCSRPRAYAYTKGRWGVEHHT